MRYKLKKIAFCEVFESKSSLYYDDNDYHINKIGAFTTSDFDIVFGNIGEQSTGTITAPANISFLQPLKIGDIINVTITNELNLVTVAYNYIAKNEEVFLSVNPLSKAFVVKSFDKNRIVLQDYCEYNHSFTNVGYVGNVINEPLFDVLELLMQRKFRAFASKLYQPMMSDVWLPLMMNANAPQNHTVSFSDDFTATNVTPWSVISTALMSTTLTDDYNSEKNLNLMLSSVVQVDDGGYYVLEYLHSTDIDDNIVSVRLKQNANVSATVESMSNAEMLWVQPQKDADDYYATHIVVADTMPNGSLRLRTSDVISQASFQQKGITNVSTKLIAYDNLFTIPETVDISRFLSSDPDVIVDTDFETQRQDEKYTRFLKSQRWADNIKALQQQMSTATDTEKDQLAQRIEKIKKTREEHEKQWAELDKKIQAEYEKNSSNVQKASRDSFVQEMQEYFGVPLQKSKIQEIVHQVINDDGYHNGTTEKEMLFDRIISDNILASVKSTIKKEYTAISLTCKDTDFYSTNFWIYGYETVSLMQNTGFGNAISEYARCVAKHVTSDSIEYTFKTIARMTK